MANHFEYCPGRASVLGTLGTLSRTTTQYNTQYTFGSAGVATAVRFFAPSTTALSSVLLFVSGSAGSGNTITVELRNDSASSNVPGTLVTNGTATVSSGTTANKWVKATFSTPPAITAGSVYWIVVGNAAANASTNNFTLVRFLNTGTGLASDPVTNSLILSVGNSTNGFSTNAGQSVACPCVALSFADGNYLGWPYTQTSSNTSNTRERGLKIAGLTGVYSVSQLSWVTSSEMSGFKIYSGSTAPGGAADYTATFSASQQNIGSYRFTTPYVFQPATVYRIVFTFSSASTKPGYHEFVDASTYLSDLQSCGFGGGSVYHTIDDGAGGWTDETDKFPFLTLMMNDLALGVVTVSAAEIAASVESAFVDETGTAQAGASSSITLAADADANNNFYRYASVRIKSGTGAGQVRQITAYVGSTKVATVDTAWVTTPDSTSVYQIIGRIV